jgi:hypothetical protein
MSKTMRTILALLSLIALPGCFRTVSPAVESSSATSADTSISTSGVPPDTESTTDTTSTTTGSTSNTTEGSTTCLGFLCESDYGGNLECDLWAEDCPEGEKCMPWANDGGSSWNALKCVPIDPNPKGLYEPCTVEGNGVSGIDDCGKHMMCWNVDPDTLMGTCFGFCTGSEQNPGCEDPDAACRITGDGVLVLCFPRCDPLMPSCMANEVCVDTGNGEFSCVIDASGDMGAYGDPCEYVNVCDPGLFCAKVEAVPGCMSSIGCCSEFCALDQGDAQCAGFADGQVCVPWFEQGMAPPWYENVGGCVVPP